MPSLNNKTIREIIRYVDKAGMSNLGIVVDLDGRSQEIRTPAAQCFFNADYVVVEIITEKGAALKKSNSITENAAFAALNCTGVVVLVVVTGLSAVAEVPTFGLSTPLTVMGAVGTVGGISSCANSALRTYNAIRDNGKNQHWDSIPTYRTAVQLMDYASLVGVASTIGQVKNVAKILQRSGVYIKSAGKGAVARQGRKRLAKELITANNPSLTPKQIKDLMRSGAQPTVITNKAVSTKMITTLMESFSAGLTILSSSLDGNIKNLAVSLARLENQ